MEAVSGGWERLGILATVDDSLGGGPYWSVIATNNNEFEAVTFNAVAICAR
jgi:hypothetical protein